MLLVRGLIVAVIIFAVACTGALAFGKTTIDPNTIKHVEAPSSNYDKRLDQKITYNSDYNRLWKIVEDLNGISGVRVRSGRNQQAWRDRDLPLVVCANDVRLGKMLASIADTTHLAFTSTRVGDDSSSYRIWFSDKLQREWDDYVAGKYKAQLAMANWGWDALIAFGDVKDSDIKPEAMRLGYLDNRVKLYRTLSKMVQSLGPDARQRVFSGQRIDITRSNCADPEIFQQMYSLAKMDNKIGQPIKEPTEQDLDGATFSVILFNYGAGKDFNVNCCIAPIIEERTEDSFSCTTWTSSLQYELNDLWDQMKDRSVPPMPGMSSFKEPPDHRSATLIPLRDDPRFDTLRGNSSGPNEWTSPKLQAAVKIELPADRDVSFAETIAAISKASGWTIIAEDYIDHKNKWSLRQTLGLHDIGGQSQTSGKDLPVSPLKIAKIEAALGDILVKLAHPNGYSVLLDWYVDDKNKIAVGRADAWLDHHLDLMPESLLVELQDKANHEGIELDGLVKLTDYTLNSQDEWVRQSRNLCYMREVACGNTTQDLFWHFYQRLPAQDKALAKSEAGLPLMKYDTRWICSFIESVRQANQGITIHIGEDPEARQRREEEEQDRRAILSNPHVVQSLVLHIKSAPYMGFIDMQLESLTYGDYRDYLSYQPQDRHIYLAELDGYNEGEPVHMKLNGPYKYFPVFSPEREKELDKRRKGAEKK